MYLLFQWLVISLTIFMIPNLISGVSVEGFGAAVAGAAVLGILNTLLRPILILLTLPITLVTLGLFLLFINALTFSWMGKLVSGVHVESFSAAFLAALIVSAVSWIMNLKVHKEQNGSRVFIVRGGTPRPTRDLNP